MDIRSILMFFLSLPSCWISIREHYSGEELAKVDSYPALLDRLEEYSAEDDATGEDDDDGEGYDNQLYLYDLVFFINEIEANGPNPVLADLQEGYTAADLLQMIYED